MPGRRTALRVLGYVGAWLAVAVPAWMVVFTHSTVDVVLASHDATLRPNLAGEVRLDMGPYLPDLRTRADGPIGVDLEVGKTNASTTAELAQRYAAIATRPEAEQQRITEQAVGLAVDAALTATAIGLVPIALWLALGQARRRQLFRWHGRRNTAIGVAVVVGATLLVWQPWRPDDEAVPEDLWIPIQDAVTDVTVPEELTGWEIQGGLMTQQTRRLLLSLFDTYERSKVFYEGATARVPEIADDLRTPEEGETVAVLVSDRHDNVGMDAVVRAVADEVGANVVMTAGDDTSTGATWEAFSLASLDEAFKDYDAKISVAGNHDHGGFVSRRLKELGWTHLDGKPVEPFGDVRMTGVDDPRSSGLGTWRDEEGLSFADVRERIADDVCALDEDGERIATLLVHDANLGADALDRGCTDLVVGGHLHSQVGPTRVVGENGVGYTYTNGTTGGAAYAIAVGSKPRREAMFTFVTYAEGRPVGIQPVTVRTTGEIVVSPYVALDLDDDRSDQDAAPADRTDEGD